jgi:drug/metabolite transporter (DMT)-like permease
VSFASSHARLAVIAARASANLRDIVLMTVATAVFACMHSLVRYTSAELHPFEIAFFRNLFGLAAVLPLLLRAGRAGLVTRRPALQALRGAIGVVAMLAWFYGLSVVPIAEATALSFSSAIFGSLGAVVFLGERMRLRRWAAVFIGFAGTLMILRPGLAAVDAGALMVILSSISWAGSLLIVKALTRTDSNVSIVTWMAIMMTALSLPPALVVWRWPGVEQLLWLGLIGGLGTLGHLAAVQAFRQAEATAVLPLDFLRLLWTSLIGYLAFAEVPDLWTWLGGAVIFASTTYIAYREARLRRAETAAAPNRHGRAAR